MAVELRLLDRQNLEQKQKFLDILLASYSKVPYPPTLDIFDSSSKNFFWAYVGSELIGISGLHQKTPTLAETIKTVVLDGFQGKGYGQQLSQAIEDQCRKSGIKKVLSTIYASNIKMISIKLAQGYTIEGYHPDHEAPGWHEYSLGKLL